MAEGAKGRGLQTLKSRVTPGGRDDRGGGFPRLGGQGHLLHPGWYLSNGDSHNELSMQRPAPAGRCAVCREPVQTSIGKRSYCAATAGSYNEASLERKWGNPATEGR